MDQHIVTITLGQYGPSFTVHKDVLCHHSPYFRNAFCGSFCEAKSNTITLSDLSAADAKTFRVFLQWAYLQTTVGDVTSAEDDIIGGRPIVDTLFKKCGRNDLDKLYGKEVWHAKYNSVGMSLLRLFILADKYDVPQLRDDIMTVIVQFSNQLQFWPAPETSLLSTCFDSLPSTSSFARYLVHVVSFLCSPEGEHYEHYVAVRDELPRDFIFDLMMEHAQHRFSVLNRSGRDLLDKACNYHEHTVLGKEACAMRVGRCEIIFVKLMKAFWGEKESADGKSE